MLLHATHGRNCQKRHTSTISLRCAIFMLTEACTCQHGGVRPDSGLTLRHLFLGGGCGVGPDLTCSEVVRVSSSCSPSFTASTYSTIAFLPVPSRAILDFRPAAKRHRRTRVHSRPTYPASQLAIIDIKSRRRRTTFSTPERHQTSYPSQSRRVE